MRRAPAIAFVPRFTAAPRFAVAPRFAIAISFACAFACAFAFAGRCAHGFGAGVTGDSGKPPAASCNGCHSGGAAPTVTLTGPATLAGNDSATYTLDIVSAASTARVGFDVAASAGTLATVSQALESQLLGGELTHTTNWPKGKDVMVSFQLTAPAQAGTVTLFGTGLTSDAVDDTGGDKSAAATLSITITPPPDLAGADFSAADFAVAPDLTLVRRDEPSWSCSFAAASSSALPSLLFALALVLLARRSNARRPD